MLGVVHTQVVARGCLLVVHLFLTTGHVACSGALTASYNTAEVTEFLDSVTCEKCRDSEFYKARVEACKKVGVRG